MGTPKSEISREKSDIVGFEGSRKGGFRARTRARPRCAAGGRNACASPPPWWKPRTRARRVREHHAPKFKARTFFYADSALNRTRRRENFIRRRQLVALVSCRSHSHRCLAAASLLASSLARVSSLHFPSDYHIFACVVGRPSHSAPLSNPPSSLHLKSFPATSASDSSTAQNASGATGNSAGAPPSSFGATLGAGASG